MLIPQNLVLFSSDFLHVLPVQDPAPAEGLWGAMIGMGVAALILLLLVTVVGFRFQSNRRKHREMKIRVLEGLAQQGKIGREDIVKALGNDGGLATKVLVVSWVGFLLSIFFVVMSQAMYQWRDALVPAVFAAVVFFALLSTPFLLSEYRRTQEP